MRHLFTDGVNSAAHFAFGALAARAFTVPVVLGFLAYQLTQQEQTNTVIDIVEFAVGYATAALALN